MEYGRRAVVINDDDYIRAVHPTRFDTQASSSTLSRRTFIPWYRYSQLYTYSIRKNALTFSGLKKKKKDVYFTYKALQVLMYRIQYTLRTICFHGPCRSRMRCSKLRGKKREERIGSLLFCPVPSCQPRLDYCMRFRNERLQVHDGRRSGHDRSWQRALWAHDSFLLRLITVDDESLPTSGQQRHPYWQEQPHWRTIQRFMH